MVEQEQNCNEVSIESTPGATQACKTLPIPKEGLLCIEARIVDVLSNYSIAGTLVGFTPGEVALFVQEPLSEQRTVAVHLDSFSFEGETLYCAPYEGKYEIHVSINDVEGLGLRRSPRFPVTVPADLLRPNGETIAITIRDISRDGMGIELPCPIEVGQPAAISSGPAFVFAVVRYCQPIQAGLFRAGLEMHHLFERPLPPVEPPQPNLLRNVWRRCFSERAEMAARAKLLRIAE